MLSENKDNTQISSQTNDNFLIAPASLFRVHSWLQKQESDKMKFFLEKAFAQGVDINIQKPEFMNSTLLHYFILWDFSEIVEFLLNKGADTSIRDSAGNTPLHELANSYFFNKLSVNTTKLLIQNTYTEFRNLKGLTPIQLATKNGNTELVKLLIQYDADINVIAQRGDYIGKSLIKLVPEDKPELKALIKLTKACKDNAYDILDDSITSKDIQEFLDWQTSITPKCTNANIKACFKHLRELSNFKKFLETKSELINPQELKKLNDSLYSSINLKDLLVGEIVKTPELYDKSLITPLPEDLINQIESWKLELAGKTTEASAETV